MEGPLRERRSFEDSDVNMVNPALVLSAFNDVYTETVIDSANKKTVGKRTTQTTYFSREKVITVGDMNFFSTDLKIEGVSVNAAKLISDAKTEGSATN